jgi:enoyl-CoA hydratase/carnithine racemase
MSLGVILRGINLDRSTGRRGIRVEYQNILWNLQDGVGTITMNRPNAMNALNRQHLAELNHAVERARYDADVRSLVITGAGRGFCAGADVKEWGSGQSEGDEPEAGWIDLAHTLIARIYRLPKPVVAAVNGVAVGMGCDIALASDLRVASTSARFGQAYIRLGYCPDAGGSYLLPRLIGEARAMEMIYTGRIIESDEADRIGLLNRLVEPDELMPAAMELAGRLAKGPTVAIGLSKQNIRRNTTLSIEDALLNERRSGEICGKTEDAKEGLAATLERRDANFQGR